MTEHEARQTRDLILRKSLDWNNIALPLHRQSYRFWQFRLCFRFGGIHLLHNTTLCCWHVCVLFLSLHPFLCIHHKKKFIICIAFFLGSAPGNCLDRDYISDVYSTLHRCACSLFVCCDSFEVVVSCGLSVQTYFSIESDSQGIEKNAPQAPRNRP